MTTKTNYFMIRACSWCKNIIGTKPVEEREMDGETTHSACPACKAQFLENLFKLRTERIVLENVLVLRD